MDRQPIALNDGGIDSSQSHQTHLMMLQPLEKPSPEGNDPFLGLGARLGDASLNHSFIHYNCN